MRKMWNRHVGRLGDGGEMYMILMSRLLQCPERYEKMARGETKYKKWRFR
jgi:hypothetical protein